MSLLEKKKREPRSHVLPPLRLTGTEYSLIRQKAESASVSLSEYVRRCCLDGYVIEKRPIADITLIKELKRQGVNFNQYQHRLNALSMDAPEDIRRIATRIEKILDTLIGIESGSKD